MNTSKKTVPLSKEERQRLCKNSLGFFIFLPFIAIFFGVLFYKINDATVLIAAGCFLTLTLLFLGFMFSASFIDATKGNKTVIRGVVASKATSTLNYRTTRFVYIGEEKVMIPYQHYGSIQSGDHIEVHFGPKSQLTLAVAILSSPNSTPLPATPLPATPLSFKDLLEQELEVPKETNSKQVTSFKDRLSALDKEHLYKFHLKDSLFTLLTFIFTLFLTLSLSFNGMIGFLIFLFPIPIGCIVSFIKLIKKYLHYKSDLNSGNKTVESTFIIEKYESTRKNKRSYAIKTINQHFMVSSKVYDLFNYNDEVTVFITSKTQKVFAIKQNKRSTITYL